MTRGKSKYIVVFGCGRLGASIANLASSLGHSVVVVDRNEYAFHRLNSEFSGFTVVGDAAEYETLKESGMEKRIWFLPSQTTTARTFSLP